MCSVRQHSIGHMLGLDNALQHGLVLNHPLVWDDDKKDEALGDESGWMDAGISYLTNSSCLSYVRLLSADLDRNSL